jgi:hypothetical protein
VEFEKVYEKVQWIFMLGVLQRNFSQILVGWVKQIIRRYRINTNGTPGVYFRTCKGLIEGRRLFIFIAV